MEFANVFRLRKFVLVAASCATSAVLIVARCSHLSQKRFVLFIHMLEMNHGR